MYLFLINPEAGSGRFAKIKRQLEALLAQLEVKYRFVTIENLADIDDLVEDNVKSNVDGIVAVGGNATVNAVINALVSENVPLLIMPLSRTNHLAHSLGIRSWEQAVRCLVTPQYHEARLGKIGKHYFIGRAEVVSHHNVLAKYISKTNFFLNFLGLKPRISVPEHAVDATIRLDDQIKVKGRVHRVDIELAERQGDKKLQINIVAQEGAEKLSTSRLYSDSVEAESETRMPVLIGNETIAHTPITITGLSKYIRLIVPKSKLTEKPAS